MSNHRTREHLVRKLATVREEEARLEKRIAELPERPHNIGDRYTIKAGVTSEVYMLVQVAASAFALVSMRSGNRWSDAYTVDKYSDFGTGLTDEEFRLVAGDTNFYKLGGR